MYVQEGIWPIVSNDRRVGHISFIALNPHSNEAVLTGIMSIANKFPKFWSNNSRCFL